MMASSGILLTEEQRKAELSLFFHKARRAMNIKGGFSSKWDLNYNCHEVAHWILADKQRRDKCCFGLLQIQDSRNKFHEDDCGVLVPHGWAEFEEAMASLLGIAFMSMVSVPWAWGVLVEDNWIDLPQMEGQKAQWSHEPPYNKIEILRRRNLWPPEKALETLKAEMDTGGLPRIK